MTIQLANITLDCADVGVVARFWSAALDRPIDPDASEHFASIGLGQAPPGSAWFFVAVPEPKTAKNR